MFGGTGATVSTPSASEWAALGHLLELVINPDKAREAKGMVDQYTEAAERSERALAEVRQEQSKLEADRTAHNAAITKERQEHDAALTRERAQWNSEHAARLAEIGRMEVQAREALAKAEGDSKHAAQMRRGLEEKLKKLHALAA